MRGRSADAALVALLFLAVAAAHYLVFIVVPNERVMGPVQRIFYFHVASAIASYVAMGGVLVGSLGYLATRNIRYDGFARACGEVGLAFCSIVMATGMIWGNAAWNTPFRWEPRLVTSLFLLLIFVSYVLLRSFGDPKRIAAHCAVLGVLGALTVPAVVFSIKLLPQSAQLHPVVVERGGLREASFTYTLFYTMFAVVALEAMLVWLGSRVAWLEERRRR